MNPLFLEGCAKADKQNVRAAVIDLGNDVIVLGAVVVIVTVMGANNLETAVSCLKHHRCPSGDARISTKEI
jgi:hypothetical protein